MKTIKYITLFLVAVCTVNANVRKEIRERAAQRFPDNYQLQELQISSETEAVGKIVEYLDTHFESNNHVMLKIAVDADKKFPNRYQLQWLYIKSQVAAYERMRVKLLADASK